MSKLHSFAALQPKLHGFRSSDAMKGFESIIGGVPKNPDALIEAIKGVQSTANMVGNAGPTGSSGGGSQEPRIQQNSKGEFRYSTDGGKTWQNGKPPQR